MKRAPALAKVAKALKSILFLENIWKKKLHCNLKWNPTSIVLDLFPRKPRPVICLTSVLIFWPMNSANQLNTNLKEVDESVKGESGQIDFFKSKITQEPFTCVEGVVVRKRYMSVKWRTHCSAFLQVP